MYRLIVISLLALLCYFPSFGQPHKSTEDVMDKMVLANQYFMKKWPEPAMTVITNKERTSNLWTRGVYYEGLMSLYTIDSNPEYLQYALDWAEGNNWSLRFGKESRHADPMCAGQTYLDLYSMDPQPERIADLKFAVDRMVNSELSDDWTWIDALQMAMPVFARFAVLEDNSLYSERMFDLYMHSKTIEGGGLYNSEEHLWWRDKDFVPPYKTPSGQNCYWSRGNGWVILALARVMDILPESDPHYSEYKETYLEMMNALLPLQREDGFWNVSLTDPTHYGGAELSGTALFVYGMAWGVNRGWLSKVDFEKAINKGWDAINKCVHQNGMLGFVQGTGKEPKDGQPLSFDKKPDFEDYGLGCFLLAASELFKYKSND